MENQEIYKISHLEWKKNPKSIVERDFEKAYEFATCTTIGTQWIKDAGEMGMSSVDIIVRLKMAEYNNKRFWDGFISNCKREELSSHDILQALENMGPTPGPLCEQAITEMKLLRTQKGEEVGVENFDITLLKEYEQENAELKNLMVMMKALGNAIISEVKKLNDKIK